MRNIRMCHAVVTGTHLPRYTVSIMYFIVNNQEKFPAISAIHSSNTGINIIVIDLLPAFHVLRKVTSSHCAGNKILDSSPCSLINLMNE